MVQRSVARDTARVTRTSKGDVRACPTLRLELLYCMCYDWAYNSPILFGLTQVQTYYCP
jgi:hypothetical protein